MTSLPTLFGRVLLSASRASDLPTIEQSTQELVQSSLSDLRDLESRIKALNLFSSNETLEDISTKDLVYLLVPFVSAEVGGRVRTWDGAERIQVLGKAQRYLRIFSGDLEKYEIIPEDEHILRKKKTSLITDPAQRRELKINQYKNEKELRARIETLRKRPRQFPPSSSSSTDFDLISSLLPSPSSNLRRSSSSDSDSDSSVDDILRETTLLLLRLFYAQAQDQLESMDQELELLRTAPPSRFEELEEDDDERRKRREERDFWKLDVPQPRAGESPLLDPSGKPLRPFKILPSSPTRSQLQSQVFAPGHNLPTMTVDEYLEIERRRGKFISGGGSASAAQTTSSEQLAIDTEQDGTIFGREKEEEKRAKDEAWARFTDANPKGAGNTMNRG